MDGNKKVSIVTHNSGFHTDDIFAVATLSLLLEKEGKEFEIIRSRDSSVIESADYVVDVGGIYDPKINRFDHHQEGRAGKRENSVDYAAFGLVWKQFGIGLSGSVIVYEKIDKILVQPIDALDNGIKLFSSEIEGLMPVDVGLLTFMFYPTWKEEDLNIDDRFVQLVGYAKFILRQFIKSTQDSVEAEQFVLEAYNKAKDKRIVDVGSNQYPWNEVLSRFPEPVFVIYKNIKNDTWSMKAIRDDMSSFNNRKDLPQEWAGKSNEELDSVTGVSGCIFCHTGRFMAVNKTKDGILRMAEIALND